MIDLYGNTNQQFRVTRTQEEQSLGPKNPRLRSFKLSPNGISIEKSKRYIGYNGKNTHSQFLLSQIQPQHIILWRNNRGRIRGRRSNFSNI
jgi:hypothetical protein